MRFFVLALMMVLLPLRGWTGDAMATDMASHMTVNIAAQQLHQTVTAPQKADAHHEHLSHEGRSDHAAHDGGQGDGHSAGQCESCSVCQTCHNVALLVISDELKPRLNTLWTPTVMAGPFASADSALDQKPPIS